MGSPLEPILCWDSKPIFYAHSANQSVLWMSLEQRFQEPNHGLACLNRAELEPIRGCDKGEHRPM